MPASPPTHIQSAPAGANIGPQPLSGFTSLSTSRMVHVAASLTYLAVFLQIYADYVSYTWGYTGLLYRPLEFSELGFIVAGVAVVSFTMPQRILRPSSIILWLMYAFVYVPTMAITFMLGAYPSATYVAPLGALTLAFVAAGLVSQWKLPPARETEALPGNTFIFILLALLGVLTVVQYVIYGDIISFASVDDIYYQRFAASEIGGGPIGYARTHYFYVLAPAVTAIALCSPRHRLLLPVGIAGFVFTYMIDASKIALLVPLVVVALYFSATRTSNGVGLFTGALTLLTFFCSLLTSQVSFARFLADLVIVRSITIPAQTFHQYFDLFTQRGYTWWSSINGIRYFMPPPPAFANDQQWPALGLIVGREYYGSNLMNANANLFCGEGVAAAGAFGVLVIGFFFCVWLRAIDLAARGWNRIYVLLIATPLGLCLTNAHLSTMLLSFGGVFWLLVLWIYKPTRSLRLPLMRRTSVVA